MVIEVIENVFGEIKARKSNLGKRELKLGQKTYDSRAVVPSSKGRI